jgi:hypothetical protein
MLKTVFIKYFVVLKYLLFLSFFIINYLREYLKTILYFLYFYTFCRIKIVNDSKRYDKKIKYSNI